MEHFQHDYHDLYLKTDVLLLADVMENFRKVCRANYGLDPLWCYTAPGLAWDALLGITGVELELISDPDMYLFIERGIRGGIHHKNKQYLSLGLKLTKVHRGVKFFEKSWMKEYIQLNTDLRTKGTTDFEKDFFKLMNNSVF